MPHSIQRLISYLIDSQAVTKIVLFGSQARGTAASHSDYDFAIWVNNRSAWAKLLADVTEKNLTLLPVDLLLYEELSIEYRSQIDREGQLIYEA